MAYTTIDKPSDYFEAKLYTGNESNLNITGLDFAPNLVWIKDRTTDHSNCFYDSVRGVQKRLQSNNNEAEGTDAQGVTAFNSDGFTIGNSSSVNQNNDSFVSWNWLGGGSASSNSNGSISSSVSASSTSGFSIVSYTGTGSAATVGHGLGVVPKIVLVKRRSQASNWCMYNVNVGNTKALYLNNDTVGATSTTFWNDTTPTSSVFTVGSDAATNGSSDTQIAFCFSEVKGFSKFGKYTGNGNADGTFVYTGFKPAMVICKKADSDTNDWFLMDNKRNGFNGQNYNLEANTNEAEQSNSDIDILSNGFKTKSSGNGHNTNGHGYIYMAFAENPFVTSTGIPTTAR